MPAFGSWLTALSATLSMAWPHTMGICLEQRVVMTGGAPGIKWVEAMDAARHPTVPRRSPTGSDLVPNVHSAEKLRPGSNFSPAYCQLCLFASPSVLCREEKLPGGLWTAPHWSHPAAPHPHPGSRSPLCGALTFHLRNGPFQLKAEYPAEMAPGQLHPERPQENQASPTPTPPLPSARGYLRDTESSGDPQSGKAVGREGGRGTISGPFFPFLKSPQFIKRLLPPSVPQPPRGLGWPEPAPSALRSPSARGSAARQWLRFHFGVTGFTFRPRRERRERGRGAVSGAASTPVPSGPLTPFPDLPLARAFLESRSKG